MGPDDLASFEERRFRQWDPASLGDVCRAIQRRRPRIGRLTDHPKKRPAG
jgi:hypothetical protein